MTALYFHGESYLGSIEVVWASEEDEGEGGSRSYFFLQFCAKKNPKKCTVRGVSLSIAQSLLWDLALLTQRQERI